MFKSEIILEQEEGQRLTVKSWIKFSFLDISTKKED